MIEINCEADIEKYAETRLIRLLNAHPKWRYDHKSTMFVYDESVIFAFSELGQCALEGHCLLLRLVWTIPSARQKGKTLEALKSLIENAELAKCAILASVSPFVMKRKVYDVGLALNRMRLNQFTVLDADKAKVEIEGMKRLLSRALFQNQIDLHGVLNFLDPKFPQDRQFFYCPQTMDDGIKRFFQFYQPDRIAELFIDDEAA